MLHQLAPEIKRPAQDFSLENPTYMHAYITIYIYIFSYYIFIYVIIISLVYLICIIELLLFLEG